MKKIFLFCLGAAICSALLLAKDPSSTVDYSGNWVLDFTQTKNPPPGLRDYRMAVAQDGKELKVQTSVEGDLQSSSSSNGTYPDPNGGQGDRGSGGGYPGGGYPGRSGGMGGGGMGRIGMPGGMGGMGMPGGGGGGRGGRSRPASYPEGNVAAYKLYPASAVYKLDGTESTAQLGDHDSTDASSKAEWGKDGELKVTLVGNHDAGSGSGKIQLKDKWKLAQDRQSLSVERAVHSPEGSGTAHLVFRKQAADTEKSAQ